MSTVLGISMSIEKKILRHDLDELVTLHGLPLLGQKRPFHTCVRVYSKGADPLHVDPMAIRADLAVRYVDQDCSFDLRVLMVKGGEVIDAYLFPGPSLRPRVLIGAKESILNNTEPQYPMTSRPSISITSLTHACTVTEKGDRFILFLQFGDTDVTVSVKDRQAMPRKARIVIPGVAHHVVRRGHNRQVVFAADEFSSSTSRISRS